MKATMIKRFNVVISLWLIAIIGTLVIFGYELDLIGCYIAAMVVGILLAATNIITLVSGLTLSNRKLIKNKEKYSNYR